MISPQTNRADQCTTLFTTTDLNSKISSIINEQRQFLSWKRYRELRGKCKRSKQQQFQDFEMKKGQDGQSTLNRDLKALVGSLRSQDQEHIASTRRSRKALNSEFIRVPLLYRKVWDRILTKYASKLIRIVRLKSERGSTIKAIYLAQGHTKSKQSVKNLNTSFNSSALQRNVSFPNPKKTLRKNKRSQAIGEALFSSVWLQRWWKIQTAETI